MQHKHDPQSQKHLESSITFLLYHVSLLECQLKVSLPQPGIPAKERVCTDSSNETWDKEFIFYVGELTLIKWSLFASEKDVQ